MLPGVGITSPPGVSHVLPPSSELSVRNRRSFSTPRLRDAAALILWEVWITLHFEALFRAPLAVRSNKQQPFVGVQRLTERAVGNMIAQIRRRFQESDRLGAALQKMIEGLGVSPPARGHQWRRRLRLVAAVRNHGQNHGVDFRSVAIGRPRRSLHDLLRDILEK